MAIAVLAFGSLRVVHAQGLPDAPHISRASPQRDTRRFHREIPPTAARQPWFDTREIDSSYWASTTALIGATVLNVELTAHCSEQGTCLHVIGNKSRATLYAYTLPVDVIVSLVSLHFKSNNKAWYLPQALLTGASMFSAGRSYGRLR